MAGLCKNVGGKAVKVVGCSCVVVKRWGEQTPVGQFFRNMLRFLYPAVFPNFFDTSASILFSCSPLSLFLLLGSRLLAQQPPRLIDANAFDSQHYMFTNMTIFDLLINTQGGIRHLKKGKLAIIEEGRTPRSLLVKRDKIKSQSAGLLLRLRKSATSKEKAKGTRQLTTLR